MQLAGTYMFCLINNNETISEYLLVTIGRCTNTIKIPIYLHDLFLKRQHKHQEKISNLILRIILEIVFLHT